MSDALELLGWFAIAASVALIIVGALILLFVKSDRRG